MNVNSAIIEVVIGLIFVYSLLSILVTQINTVIVNLLNLRAKHLKVGLDRFISDPVVRAKFLTHPLVDLVKHPMTAGEQITPQKAQDVSKAEVTKVNWVASETFVNVLSDILGADLSQSLYAPLYSTIDVTLTGAEKARFRGLVRRWQNTGKGITELKDAIANLPDSPAKQALTQATSEVEVMLVQLQAESGGSELLRLLEGARNVDNPAFRRALEAVLAGARDIDDAQKRLSSWFDHSMERVSDSYKRYMQFLSLLIGFLLASLLNVDTLHLARTLWDDPALRNTVASAAQASVEAPALTDSADGGVPPAEEAALDENINRAQGTIQDLLELRLPIGWEWVIVTPADIAASEGSLLLPDPRKDLRNFTNLLPGYNTDWLGFLLWKLIGVAITMVAVAQGAPFWFDLLNRLARGGGGGPKSSEENV